MLKRPAGWVQVPPGIKKPLPLHLVGGRAITAFSNTLTHTPITVFFDFYSPGGFTSLNTPTIIKIRMSRQPVCLSQMQPTNLLDFFLEKWFDQLGR